MTSIIGTRGYLIQQIEIQISRVSNLSTNTRILNYRVLNLDMPQSIKSDRTILEMQGIESLTPKY